MKKCLYVGNLPRTATELEVRQLFAGTGVEVEEVTLAIDRRSGRSRGFAFVEMPDEEAANAALAAVQGAEIAGQALRFGHAFRDKAGTGDTVPDYEYPPFERRGSSRRRGGRR